MGVCESESADVPVQDQQVVGVRVGRSRLLGEPQHASMDDRPKSSAPPAARYSRRGDSVAALGDNDFPHDEVSRAIGSTAAHRA